MVPFSRNALTVAISASLLLLTACGGGGGGSGSSSGSEETIINASSGYQLPNEISAVPADNTVSGQGLLVDELFSPGTKKLATSKGGTRSFSSALNIMAALVADLDDGSDYKQAKAKRYVEERALEQFDIIEQVMSAVGQTNYTDVSVLNQGPYTAMVTWIDDDNGREVKTLQPWIVDSTMVSVDGTQFNRVRAWIEEPDDENPGEVRTIKAEFKIYAAANVEADGSYTDYGDWDLNVSFDESGLDYFVGRSRVTNGITTLMVHERMNRGSFHEVRGILNRGVTTGYGKVEYPDWSNCMSNPCTPGTIQAGYAYNADYLAVQVDGQGSPTYKDRDLTSAVEMTHRYGLYYADADISATPPIVAGDSVEKHLSFGFPLKFTDGNSLSRYAYYGAWQGRHEIWGGSDESGNALLSAGDTVIRDDHAVDETPQTYVVSALFSGTLTKRTLVDGDLSDIQDIPVETWLNKHYDLNWSATDSEWQYCDGWLDWSANPKVCRAFVDDSLVSMGTFNDFSSLVFSENDRKFVHIGGWDQALNSGSGGQVNYVYLTSDPSNVNWSGTGFYPAENNQQGQLAAINAGSLYTPADGDNLGVDIGGSIYIEYTGSGWVEKSLVEFDQETWTPTFDSNADAAFTPELGREYYINNQGASFVVKRVASSGTDADMYQVKIELQSAANPKNISSILPTGTSYLSTPWRPEVKFTLVTDSTDSDFMKLIYLADDTNTQDVDETGMVVTDGEWGLQAFNVSDEPLAQNGDVVPVDGYGIVSSGTVNPVQFNWEYSTQGWGTQQFLCTPDCSLTANYLTLEDPVQLQPVVLTNGAGDSKTLSLQFDGWMHGMPNLYHDLSKNGFVMTPAIANKVVNINAGTEVVDALDGTTSYFVKPLEVSLFLNVVTTPDAGKVFPDISQADTANLNDVPNLTPHGMGVTPQDTDVLFSEGLPVE